MTVLVGMAALVLDVGSWYRAQRQLQATADAAALAGAQALPESTSDAYSLALEYADKNGGGLAGSGITFSGGVVSNDTINVRLSKPAPGFFSKLFGLASVDVGAHASARSDNAAEALYVAPIVVNEKHPMLQPCGKPPLPCDQDTEIDLMDLHKPGSGNAAGSFGLINLRKNDNTGSVGAKDLGNWIRYGFGDYLSIGDFYAVPSTKWNSIEVRSAMTDAMQRGRTLLFPIYRTIEGPGDNAVYKIVGWVGFYVKDFDSTGSSGAVYGHFTRFVAQGTQIKRSGEMPDYGVRVVQLVD